MLYDTGTSGQLTVIHSGVRYPVSSNVGRFLEMLHDRIRVFLIAGLPHDGVIDSVEVTQTRWAAVVLSREGHVANRIIGSRDSSTRLRIDSLESARVDGAALSALSFHDHEYNAELDRVIPRRVIYERSDGITEDYTVKGVVRRGLSEIRNLSARPSVGAHIRVIDYNSADSRPGVETGPQPMMVWRQSGGVDSYEVIEALRATGAPGAPPEQRSRRGFALIVAAFVTVIVPVIVAWRRWSH